jgi:hypothetical protein
MFAERLIIGPLVLIIGLLFCFAGYRLFRVIMAIWGFLIGFFVSLQMVPLFLGSSVVATGLSWATGVILGLVLATLAYALYTAAMTLMGASVGYLLGTGLMTALGVGNQTVVVIVVGLVLALLFAVLILALDLARLLIVGSTAMGGAASIVLGILFIAQFLPVDMLSFAQPITFVRNAPIWLLLWLALAIVGGVFQLQNTRHYRLEKYALARKVTRQ